MRIQNIKIKNIGNIDELEKSVGGHNLIAIGKNGVGKSSVIDTLFEVLQAKYSKPNSVKKGRPRGEYEIDMGEWIATFTFKPEEKTPSLKLTTKKGDSVPQSKTTLSGAVGMLDFNIDEFLSKSDSEKVKYLFKHIDLGASPEELAGIDLERKELYDERTIVNRDIDVAKKTLVVPSEADKKLAKKEIIPLNELYNEKTKASEKNNKIEYVESGITEKQSSISDIEAQIKELEEKKKALEKQIKDGEDYLSKNKIVPLEEIDKKIQEAEKSNEEIQEAKETVNRFDSINENLESDLKTQEQLNTRIKEIDDMKKNLIIEGLDIEGLDYDVYADRFVYGPENLSLNELNEALRYVIGIKIGAKQLKDLRIMRFSANDLDDDSMKQILEFGKNNDIQFFVEMMDRSKEQLEIRITESL